MRDIEVWVPLDDWTTIWQRVAPEARVAINGVSKLRVGPFLFVTDLSSLEERTQSYALDLLARMPLSQTTQKRIAAALAATERTEVTT